MATVTTIVISSWNGNSGIPPPPAGAVAEVVEMIALELLVVVDVDEIVVGAVVVEDLEVELVVVVLVVVVEVVEVVVVVLVVLVEVVVVLATGEYVNVEVLQMGFMLTESLHEAFTMYVPLIQLLVPPAAKVKWNAPLLPTRTEAGTTFFPFGFDTWTKAEVVFGCGAGVMVPVIIMVSDA